MTAWLLARHWAGRSVKRAAAIVAGVAVAVPAAVYGAFLVSVSPHTLFFENLFPRDTISGGGDVLLRARMPLTPGSLVELGGRAAIYAAGLGIIVALAKLAAKPGLGRGVAAGLVLTAGVAACGAAIVNPEALRHGLQFVYGWIPFGAAVGAVVLLVRARRRTLRERDDLRLAAVIALAVVAATAYDGFYLHAPRPQMAVYYAPLIAIFLAELHLRRLGERGRGAPRRRVAHVPRRGRRRAHAQGRPRRDRGRARRRGLAGRDADRGPPVRHGPRRDRAGDGTGRAILVLPR